MRTVLAILICCLVFPLRAGWFFAAATAGGGPTYLVEQGFEGTGYDNGETWTESVTDTVDEDYATSPAVGSQSLRIVASANINSTYVSFTAQDTVYAFCRFRWVTKGAGTYVLATVRTSSGTVQGSISILVTGVLRATATGDASATSTDAIPVDTDIYLWMEFVKGTGANAIMRAGWSTDGTKPSLAATGAKAAVSSAGTSTAQGARLMLGSSSSNTAEFIYDHVLVDDANIGNNP